MSQLLDAKIATELATEKFHDQFMPPDEFENDELARYSLKAWWSVLQANKFRPRKDRVQLYERALRCIPGSYKIWHSYLVESLEEIEYKCVVSSRYEKVSELFERALKYMQKMPRIWLMYTEFLIKEKFVTRTRETFDRALRNLPITQHELIWSTYIEWIESVGCIKSAKHIIERYLCIEPDFKEDFAEYLFNNNDLDGAAKIYYEILKDENYSSKKGKSKFQFYIDLCSMIIERPTEIKSVDCETVIREGIRRYVDEVGNLWAKLAQYFIKLGNFKKARYIFEESLQKIMTARDFGIVYNAYLKFEEEMVNAFALELEDEGEIDEDELENEMARLEKLIDRRPFLLNDVMLRANPSNVSEWLKRVKLNENDENKVLEIFAEALKTVDPLEVEGGSISEIWIRFAEFYEEHNDLKNANLIYHKATQLSYKTVDELVAVWISWIEMLIKQGFYKDALLVTKEAIFSRKKSSAQGKNKKNKKNHEGKDHGHLEEEEEDEVEEEEEIDDEVGADEKSSATTGTTISLYHNTTLWCLYIDLERNFGTFETTRTAYRRMLDIKLITPYILLNYAELLENNHYYEESFKVYETGVTVFFWPGAYDIWLIYLSKFVERYGGDKLERARDLFEKVLVSVPDKQCKIFYLMYADFEEKFGLLNHAFEIYDRMVANVPESDKLEAYNLYIAKISYYLGVTKSRPIFENAMEIFQGDNVVKIGLRFAHLERKLGEIDRARAIYTHVSQFADPRDDDLRLWKIWNDFELHHGNEDTYKEYLRIKRSVLNKFNLLPPDVEKIREKVERGEI